MIGLFIVPTDYDSLVRKGVAGAISDRLEDDLLGKAITIHPFALHDRQFEPSGRLLIMEMENPSGVGARPLLWARFLRHLSKVIYRVVRIIKQYNVDFVRAQDPYYCGLVGLIASRLTNRKFCVSLHADYDRMDELDPGRGAPCIFGSRALARRLERRVLSRADLVLAITKYIADYAKRHGARPERVRLFRHRVDVSHFSPAAYPIGSRVIAVVSRLTTQKHILDAPRIARALKDRGVSFRMEIAGDGEARDELTALIEKLGVADEILLFGFQDRQGVAGLLARAAVNLSLHGGISLVEAAMMERASVAYDWEWHSEIVVDGKTGRLVTEGDWSGAADAVAELLDDSSRAREMGVAAGHLVRGLYDTSALLKSRQDVYQELCALNDVPLRAESA